MNIIAPLHHLVTATSWTQAAAGEDNGVVPERNVAASRHCSKVLHACSVLSKAAFRGCLESAGHSPQKNIFFLSFLPTAAT